MLVILLAAIPGPARGLELRVREVGLRNFVGQGQTAVRVMVRNDSPAPLRGTVSAEFSQPWLRSELRVSSSVSLEPWADETICLPLRLHAYELREEYSLVVRLLDGTGMERGRHTVSTGPLTTGRDDVKSHIGILAENAASVRAVQNALLFPEDMADRAFFERPGLGLIHLGPDSSPCAEAYACLDSLILAAPADRLTSELRAALTEATLAGLHLTIVEPRPGRPGFLPEQSLLDTTMVFGQGVVTRVERPSDLTGSSFSSPDKDTVPKSEQPRKLLVRPEELVRIEAWKGTRFRTTETPQVRPVLVASLLYVLLVGPGTFFLLRALGRREWAWFVSPALALGFSLLLLGWVRASRFDTVELDALLVRESSDAIPYVRSTAMLRISSPRELEGAVHLPGRWRLDGDLGRLALFTDSTTVENLLVHQWATTDLTLSTSGTGPFPAFLEADGIRHALTRTVDEALLILPNGECERTGWPAGEIWRCIPEQGGTQATTGEAREGAAPGLRHLLMGRPRGWNPWIVASAALVAVTHDEGPRVALTPPAEVTRSSTLYVHVFRRASPEGAIGAEGSTVQTIPREVRP